jgi:hypothetical protein
LSPYGLAVYYIVTVCQGIAKNRIASNYCGILPRNHILLTTLAVSDIEGTGKWPAFTAESTHRDEDLECTVPPNTLKALDAPQHSPSTGINTFSSKDSDILEPDLFIASAATFGSSSPESSEPGSSSTGSTSCTSPETHIHDDFPSGVYTGYVRRLFLDDPTPWFEHVLTAHRTGLLNVGITESTWRMRTKGTLILTPKDLLYI